MQIRLNGEPVLLAQGETVARLLERMGFAGRIAVECNGVIVPRSAWASTALRPADVLEVVRAVGGG